MDRMKTLNRLLYDFALFHWGSAAIYFFWVAVEKVFGKQSYRALACLGAAVLSFVVAVYWHRIIPARFRDEAKELDYLRTELKSRTLQAPNTTLGRSKAMALSS
jgi:hypothetical protein